MRLLRAELRRTSARKFIRLTLIAGAILIAVTSAAMAIRSTRPTPQDLAAAKAARDAQVEICVQDSHGGQDARSDCDRRTIPEQYFLDPSIHPFDLAALTDVLPWAAIVLALAGWLIGVVLVGGEWEARTIAWQLTLEPRRLRLLCAKVAAASIVALVLSAILQALLAGGLLAVAELRGISTAPSGVLLAVTWEIARGALLAGLAACVGASLAVITRNGSAAIAIGIGYLVVEVLVALRIPRIGQWLPLQGSGTWISGLPATDLDGITAASMGRVGVLLACLTIGVFVIAAVSFTRRDVV